MHPGGRGSLLGYGDLSARVVLGVVIWPIDGTVTFLRGQESTATADCFVMRRARSEGIPAWGKSVRYRLELYKSRRMV